MVLLIQIGFECVVLKRFGVHGVFNAVWKECGKVVVGFTHVRIGRPENTGFNLFDDCCCAGSCGVEVAVGEAFLAFDAAFFFRLCQVEIRHRWALGAGFALGQYIEW